MERYSQKKGDGAPATGQQSASPNSETFSEMASATASRSGVVGKLLVISLIIVSVAVTAFVGFAIVRGVDGDTLVKSDQYQALFLTDGQIYFGKLDNSNDSYARLTDIYYLQVEQAVQPVQGDDAKAADAADAAAGTKISLAKLGNELHGPEDEMFVNRDRILFWENLKADGQVVTAITQFVEGGADSGN
jgi:hypothetical protein